MFISLKGQHTPDKEYIKWRVFNGPDPPEILVLPVVTIGHDRAAAQYQPSHIGEETDKWNDPDNIPGVYGWTENQESSNN